MPVIEFGVPLGPASGWGSFERRIAMIGVMSYLLEPKEEARRIGIRRALGAAELNKLARAVGVQPHRARHLAAIRSDAIAEISSIAKRRSAISYRKSLSFDLNEELPNRKSGADIPGILTAGLIVKLASQAARQGEEQRIGPEASKRQISERYEKNPLIVRNDSQLSAAWRRNRPVAHLAAALLQYVSDHKLRQFRTAERTAWRVGIVEFLEHANYFQHYLHDLSRQPTLRFKYDLLELPAEFELARTKPTDALVLPS